MVGGRHDRVTGTSVVQDGARFATALRSGGGGVASKLHHDWAGMKRWEGATFASLPAPHSTTRWLNTTRFDS